MNNQKLAREKVEQLKKGEISPREFAEFLTDPIVIVEDPHSRFYGKRMVDNQLLEEIIILLGNEKYDSELLPKLKELKKLFFVEKAVNLPSASVNVTEGNAMAIRMLLSCL